VLKKQIKNKKAFTLIELLVVMAIIGVLVLLAMPKFAGQTKEAKLTEIKSDSKQLENASERYYIDKQDWPRLSDIPYTAEQVETFAQEITNKTGQVVTLDATGSYYDIDYTKLQQYVQKPKDNTHYVIQNPVGDVFYLKNLTSIGESRLDPNAKPVAVITITPNTAMDSNTNIVWAYGNSSDADGDSIVAAEWIFDGIKKDNPNGTLSVGSHIIELKVKDARGLWSDIISQNVEISAAIQSFSSGSNTIYYDGGYPHDMYTFNVPEGAVNAQLKFPYIEPYYTVFKMNGVNMLNISGYRVTYVAPSVTYNSSYITINNLQPGDYTISNASSTGNGKYNEAYAGFTLTYKH